MTVCDTLCLIRAGIYCHTTTGLQISTFKSCSWTKNTFLDLCLYPFKKCGCVQSGAF